jgi:pimeloyl-ACP methyl ester carboxylesterase
VEALDHEQRRLAVEMLRDTPTSFIRWASRALIEWSFTGELPCPVYHLHGDRDRLLPLAKVRADRVVEGAGHLLTLTHPDVVNAFLLEHIADA